MVVVEPDDETSLSAAVSVSSRPMSGRVPLTPGCVTPRDVDQLGHRSGVLQVAQHNPGRDREVVAEFVTGREDGR